MKDNAWITLRIEHEKRGVVFDDSMTYSQALQKATDHWKTHWYRHALHFISLGDNMFRAQSGAYTYTIAGAVDGEE